MEDTVRIIRVLVYQGNRSWVEKTLATGGVPANGRHTILAGDKVNVISSMTITEFPELTLMNKADELLQKMENCKDATHS